MEKLYCKRCRSTNVIKHGHQKRWRKGKQYRVQMYLCNNCGHQFYLKRGKG